MSWLFLLYFIFRGFEIVRGIVLLKGLLAEGFVLWLICTLVMQD
jgi:hypothetical protein